jgi:hypothetical protein
MAGFQVIMYGRFWVFTEGQDHWGKFCRAFGLLEDISKSGACLKL